MSENHIDPDLAVETFVLVPVVETWARGDGCESGDRINEGARTRGVLTPGG